MEINTRKEPRLSNIGIRDILTKAITKPFKHTKTIDLEKAIRYQQKSRLHLQTNNSQIKKYPIISTSLETIGKHGIGLQLYFYFLKSSIWLFFSISILSIYPLYSNYIGKSLGSINQNTRYTYFTLANQIGSEPFERNLTTATSTITLSSASLDKLWPVDFLVNLLFLIFIPFYSYQCKKVTSRATGQNKSISEFAIQVQGFPPYIESSQILDYFSSFGVVKEIYLSRIYNGNLPKYKKFYKLACKLSAITSDSTATNKYMAAKLREFSEIIRKHDDLLVDKVFVVFNTVSSKNSCIKYHKNKVKLRKCCKKKEITRARRGVIDRLNVEQPSNPSDILWENLEYKSLDILKVRIPIIILTVMIFLAGILAVVLIKAYLNIAPDSIDCKYLNIHGDLSLTNATELYTSSDQHECYCKQQSIGSILSNSDLQHFCIGFIKNFVSFSAAKLSISTCIVVVNSILNIVINAFSKYERFKGKTEKIIYLFTHMFVLMLFNTSLTTLFCSLKIVSAAGLKGIYSDISREWYSDVGSTITTTMIVSVFSPHLLNLLIVWPLGNLKRKCCNMWIKNQYELNRFFRAPKFDISVSLAQVLTVIFTNFMYSSGIPLLNLLTLLTLLMIYWCNKILVLRYYRKPPVYSYKINQRVIQILPFSVIIHCIFAIFAFGSPDIFPSGFHVSPESKLVVVDSRDLNERIASKAGISNLLLILVAVIEIIMISNYDNLVKCIPSNKVENLTEQPEFEILKQNGELAGYEEYNLKSNPKYKKLIKILDTFASAMEGSNEQNIDHAAISINNSVVSSLDSQ